MTAHGVTSSSTSIARAAGLLLALAAAACKSDKPEGAVAEPGRGTVVTPASSSSAASSAGGRVVAPTSASSEASPGPSPDDAASTARPETITFAPLFSSPGAVQLDALSNGVVGCAGRCAASPAEHPKTMWFVDRKRVVEDPSLVPWSDTMASSRFFSFGGTYPEAVYATLVVAGDRVGFELVLKREGQLFQQAAAPPGTFDFPTEARPTPEVLAELEETRPASAGAHVAYGGGGPPMVSEDGGVRVRLDGKLKKVAIPGMQDGVRALHRMKNGYTLVLGAHRVAVLDVRGARVPLRIDGVDLEPNLESDRYGNVRAHFVDDEVWISSVLDHGKPSMRTVLAATAPRLLAPLHLQRADASAASLLNGVAKWEGVWSPSLPPGVAKPAP